MSGPLTRFKHPFVRQCSNSISRHFKFHDADQSIRIPRIPLSNDKGVATDKLFYNILSHSDLQCLRSPKHPLAMPDSPKGQAVSGFTFSDEFIVEGQFNLQDVAIQDGGQAGSSNDERAAGFSLGDEPIVEMEYNFQDVAMHSDHKHGFDLIHMAELEMEESQPEKGFVLHGDQSMEDKFHDCEEDKSAWHPGLDVGTWVRRRWAPLNAQCQVLLANLVLNLKKMPQTVLRSMVQHLPCFQECSVSSLPFRAASWLVRLPQGTLRNMYQKLQNNDWQPQDAVANHELPQATSGNSAALQLPDSASLNIMRLLVREALGPLATTFVGKKPYMII